VWLQNVDGSRPVARGRLRFHKRPQTNGKIENRATAAAAVAVDNSAPMKGRAIEGPIRVLDQRVCVNANVQRSQRGGRRDFEDRPTRCPVEVSIVRLDQCCLGIGAVGIVETVNEPDPHNQSAATIIEVLDFLGVANNVVNTSA